MAFYQVGAFVFIAKRQYEHIVQNESTIITETNIAQQIAVVLSQHRTQEPRHNTYNIVTIPDCTFNSD